MTSLKPAVCHPAPITASLSAPIGIARFADEAASHPVERAVASMATSGASRRAGRRGPKATAVSLFTIRYSVSAISIGENLPLTVEYQISIADRLRQSALQTPSRPIG